MKTLMEIAQADRYDLGPDDLVIRNAMADLAVWLRQKLGCLTAVASGSRIVAVSPELKAALLALEHGGEAGQAAVAAVPTVNEE
ncbi:hypothetical protein [Cupriavidus necator]|uniref:hypothetical protein n=1 Tax=Cupriavidus necator TaxID=106590 RepID=UPI0005B4D8B1|nr:hypothetical protein [Cupriavidus necator]